MFEEKPDYGRKSEYICPTGVVPTVGRTSPLTTRSPHLEINPPPNQINEDAPPRKHSHYYKDVSKLKFIDVYKVLQLFGVTDPCLQHLIKKALCTGARGHKDYNKDMKDIFDTASRMMEMLEEEASTS